MAVGGKQCETWDSNAYYLLLATYYAWQPKTVVRIFLGGVALRVSRVRNALNFEMVRVAICCALDAILALYATRRMLYWSDLYWSGTLSIGPQASDGSVSRLHVASRLD